MRTQGLSPGDKIFTLFSNILHSTTYYSIIFSIHSLSCLFASTFLLQLDHSLDTISTSTTIYSTITWKTQHAYIMHIQQYIIRIE